MKTILPPALLLCILYASTASAQVFFNINEEWNTQNSTINNFDQVDSQMDSNRGVVTVGNEFIVDEGSNALIQYIDNQGTLLWEVSYDYQGHDDYASSVFIDDQDNIHVSGVAYDPESQDYDFLILKINSSGQVLNAITIDHGSGKNNYAADIQSRNGNVYVTGTVENSISDYDMLTICLNSSYQLSWASTYDNIGSYDIGAKIGLYSGGIVVSGGSGTAFDNWKFATVKYNYNGAQTGAIQSANGAAQFSTPNSMITHEDGSTTILGQITNGQGDLDVTVIKLDEDLSTIWQYDYDYQGMDDFGTTFVLESNGDYTISGWFTEPTGQEKLLLLKVTSSGSLIYAKQITAGAGITNNLKGMAIGTHLGEVYVGGVLETVEGKGVAVYKTKTDGSVIWSYFGELNNDFRVSSINIVDSTNVKISGLAVQDGYSKYLTLELKTLMRENLISTG
ncbi:MAG: hypothetical protein HRT74_03515 [Flavobacteriales bacterium]|nr:hypothetical protein [Flavobacteriales bacterium]